MQKEKIKQKIMVSSHGESCFMMFTCGVHFIITVHITYFFNIGLKYLAILEFKVKQIAINNALSKKKSDSVMPKFNTIKIHCR